MTTIDGIAAPLAAALAAKGYDTLTPVQEAMRDPALADRDALVSAQTGSGKTVAFGLALAPNLLGGADSFLYADTPLALVVAPTRELALQVRRELTWLYAEAGAQITSCVGGMDFRTERRALERGAHIVVGTPGRLRDHIERNSLDLSGLRAVVLDEADEMLDLGFREDLEFILSAAPEQRRTLMFSATVPKAIAELAKEFQHDAARITTAGEARQHGDIEYRALSVGPRDRENAIINLLRFYEAQNAIVFAKTRAEVNHLMARFSNRGFPAVALSGELSQSERSHALQAMRDGRARVCIATDVAARGIDLPGLDLVVHADLPSNSETLLHRSGRTGRAGRKGVSALIVAPKDFKKANRLLQGARITAEWGKPPSADEVTARDNDRMMEAETLVDPVSDDEAPMVAELLDRFGPELLAVAFLRQWRAGRSAPEELSETVEPRPEARTPRERPEFGASVWFSLSVGHEGRAEARWILPKLCDHGGITRNEIGAIRVQTRETFVQIAAGAADGFIAKLGPDMALEPGAVLTRLAGEPTLERPERKPYGEKSERKPYGEKSERKPYGEKPERKPYGEKSERKPYASKPIRKDAPRHSDADAAAGAPYAPRPRDLTTDEARPARKPRHKPEAGAKPAWQGKQAAAKPAGAKYGAKPAWKKDGDDTDARGKPAGKPYGKSGGKTGGKTGGKPASKPYAGAQDRDKPRPAFTAGKGADAVPQRPDPEAMRRALAGDPSKSLRARPKAKPKPGGKPGPKPRGKA